MGENSGGCPKYSVLQEINRIIGDFVKKINRIIWRRSIELYGDSYRRSVGLYGDFTEYNQQYYMEKIYKIVW